MARWNAEDYHEHSEAQAAWAAELIGKLALRGDERVLDLGSGDGRVTAAIAQSVPGGSVMGLDNSEEMIRFARSHFPPAQFPNLLFQWGDARDLPFREEFDVVFSNATLHWVVDHRPVLAGLARALRPGGRALLQMGGQGNAAALFRTAEGLRSQPRWAGFFEGFTFPYRFHDAPEYREWVLEAGLAPLRVELIPKDMVKEDAAGLAGWVRTTWMPYTHQVPEEQREEFIAELVSAYLATCPAHADGRIHVAMVRLEVEARR